VKRITAINGLPKKSDGTSLATYENEATNPYDDNDITIPNQLTKDDPQKDTDKWPTPSSNLLGAVNGGVIKPKDKIEYTIYFLSTGNTEAKNVLFCDRVPSNTTFVLNSFNTYLTQAAGGVSDSRGILASINGTTASHTNLIDGDAARYILPGAALPIGVNNQPIDCGGPNDNGAVIFNLGNLPNATSPGTPAGSYGFVRFQGQVK
jgi:uncharacterized repeat protein (TIGR01451 family)